MGGLPGVHLGVQMRVQPEAQQDGDARGLQRHVHAQRQAPPQRREQQHVHVGACSRVRTTKDAQAALRGSGWGTGAQKAARVQTEICKPARHPSPAPAPAATPHW